MSSLFRAAVAGSVLIGSVVAGYAADMPVKARPVAVDRAFSWTGPYVGVNLGGARSQLNADPGAFDPLFPPFAVLPPLVPVFTVIPGQLSPIGAGGKSNGFIGGGQIGHNWQVNQFVYGLEADAVGTGLKGSSASISRSFGPPIIPPTVTQTVAVDFGKIEWMASFRGRAGFAVDRALFYATGGAAVAGIGRSTTSVVNGPGIGLPAAGTFTATNNASTTRWGWTVGGGIEWAFHKNWSVAAEYRHTDFGSRSVNITIPDGFGGVFATRTATGSLTVDQATARLNYRFADIR